MPFACASHDVMHLGMDQRPSISVTSRAVQKMGSTSRRLWILPGKPKQALTGMLGFVNYGKVPSERPDVGFLELSPEAAQGYTDFEALSLDRVRIREAGRRGKLIMLIGYPATESKPSRDDLGRMLLPAPSVAYGTAAFMLDEWPPVPPQDPPADQAIDLFLDYPSSGTTDVSTGAPRTLPHPGGTSGGGYWDLGIQPNELWSSAEAVLFGIQSSWREGQRFLRGVQIIHWLRLIHDHYLEFRSELEERYPELHDGG